MSCGPCADGGSRETTTTKRRAIPLTVQYRNTTGHAALDGVACPGPCAGRCLAACLLLCTVGVTDTPWATALDERDRAERGPGGAASGPERERTLLHYAAAIATKYGIHQAATLPPFLDELEASGRLFPSDARATLRAMTRLEGPPEGCALLDATPDRLEALWDAVPQHRPWSATFRSARDGHWRALLMLPGRAAMLVAPHERGASPTLLARAADATGADAGLLFYYSDRLYRHR